MKRVPIRILIEGGLAVALGIVLGMVSIFQMPQGGNISLAILPLLLFTMRNGWKGGVLAGLVYGILSFLLGGGSFSVHPLSILLDYLVPGAILGLMSEKRWPAKLALISVLRFASYVTSGAIVFASYAGSQNPWIYSIIYNATYLIPEMLLMALILFLLGMNPQSRRLFHR